jgi:FdrA protein
VTASTQGSVHRNSYRDSVELMGIAAQLEALDGITRAGLVMATPANLAVLAEAGLSVPETDGAGPNDLIVAVSAADLATAEAALARAAALLSEGGGAADQPQEVRTAGTLREGLEELPDANLVLVSTPGAYATAEALRALKLGINVFLFSDNVSIGDEIRLKDLADDRGLLVMGPDCGTAIVAEVPLGFANAVRRGPIGLVGASGTGLQQVTSLVHRFGSGVSNAFGTGGRDLDDRVGGRTMLAALRLLEDDPATAVIVLISKPPGQRVAERILDAVRSSTKPVVVNFLGGDPAAVQAAGAFPAATFEAAARIAVALAETGDATADGGRSVDIDPQIAATAVEASARLDGGQTEIRGLFSGGSLATEAKIVLKAILGQDRHDRILDLGDDEYTVGRPHPMIDPRLRNETIIATAAERSVGVILLDVVLGYGAHPDPAGALAPAIGDAMALAISAGRQLLVVASVCGTDLDPQDLERQERILTQTGVMLESSNARAAMLAAAIAARAPTDASDAPGAPLVGAAD